ncbi:MAG TPA: EAL domain-containing protein [Acidimicrobiales bacterium]|nr:EAL domain-containing protein [Acidimicrobiales bacterium]
MTWLLAGAAVVGLVPALTPVATLVVVPAMIAATFIGVRAWWPPAVLPWRLLAATAAVALAGAVVTLSLEEGSVPGELAPLPQYLVAGAALVAFDRARRVEKDRSLLVDGAIVGVAAGLVAFAVFVVPVLDRDLAPMAKTMRATYPALDAVLLFLVTRLGFGGAWRYRSFRLLVVGFLASLLGNLVWAAYDAQLLGEPHGLDDLGYLVSFAALGLAALDRSMAALAAPSSTVSEPWRSWRMVGLVASLAVAPAVVVLATPETALERGVYLVSALMLVGLVGWRLVTAVNEHAASEQRLAHAASHDGLTDLPNRTALAAEIDDALCRSLGGLAVVFLDLDRFKDLNDRWGHSAGDELLVAVADRLRAWAGGGNVVGRIGGDEFLIVCPEVPDAESAAALGLQTLESVRPPFTLSVGEVVISASIGVAFLEPGSYAPGEQFIRNADTAMYRAKGAGRDRVVMFAESMRAAVGQRHAMEEALRRAMERGEITLHYQPIVDLVSERPVGVEALMRWFADGRSVPPDEFIPVAEETGLIVPLGARAITEATAFLASCRERHPGLDLTMSVNLSPRQLREPDLMETVREAITAAGIPPASLSVEITESAMLDGGAGRVDETVACLRSLGVGIAADDFGTGYSSLPYLKRFVIGRLKIDRAFVQGIGVSPHDEAIVAAIIAIATSLGLEVVAEGVETADQAERLVDLGCTLGQGWLYSTALPRDIATVYLADRAQASASRTAVRASSTVIAASSGNDLPNPATS